MRIGILTFAWDNNAGQYWQAIATFQALVDMFPNAEVEVVNVRHHWNRREGKVSRKAWLMPWRAERYIRAAKAYNAGRAVEIRSSREACLTHDYTEASRFLERCGYDLLVTGADVCLKPVPEARAVGGVPFHWISPDVTARKVMLGSSADIADSRDLDELQAKRMRESALGFEYLAVRDSMTYELLQSLGVDQSRLHRTPDPTFCLPVQVSWISEAEDQLPKVGRGRKLALLHLPDSSVAREIVRFLNRNGYCCVSIVGNLPGSRWAGSLTPKAWAGMSKVADLVVTVSFHESIFALKQGRMVLAVDAAKKRFHPETGVSKTRCLMSEFGLIESNHYNPYRETFSYRAFVEKLERAGAVDYSECVKKAEEFGEQYLSHVTSLRRFAVPCLA